LISFVFPHIDWTCMEIELVQGQFILMINAMITIACQYFKKYSFSLSRVESSEVLSRGSRCNPLIALYNINHSYIGLLSEDGA